MTRTTAKDQFLAYADPWRPLDWIVLSAIVSCSLLIRLAFFTGFFGSDEVVYTNRAIQIVNGQWTSSDYIGAIRYGINIPVAFFLKLFGISEFSANLWALICGIGEISLVFIFARLVWSLRTAILSSMVIGLLPLHVNLSGRLLADTPLAFFITLSFVLFYFAEIRRSVLLYLMAGLAVGFVYWIKEAVGTLYAGAFIFYAIINRRFSVQWIWMIGSALLLILLNVILIWWIAGDPFQLFKVQSSSVGKYTSGLVKFPESPWSYFNYLFFDCRHTWIMPFLALGGILLKWRTPATSSEHQALNYTIIWGLGLLVIFSLMIISFNPLIFISKQINYMLIFMAPLSLLAGYFLASLKGWKLNICLIVLISGSIILSGLEQQAVRVFTSNSKAAVLFARQHSDVPIYVTVNTHNAASFLSVMQGENPLKNVYELADLAEKDTPKKVNSTDEHEPAAYAILDMETMEWGNNPSLSPSRLPTCWIKVTTLKPIGFGNGERVLALIRSAVAFIPGSFGVKLIDYADSLLRPRPALVYAIPNDCQFTL
jgi:4-amino-4-deoxy-L-arabinose transferase-like glycosyltransferase